MYTFLVSMISIIICGYPDQGQWNILLHQLQYHVLQVHHQLQPQVDPVWPPEVILVMVMVMMWTGVLWVWDVCSGGTLHITQGGREGQTDGDVRADHPHQAHLPRLLLLGAGGVTRLLSSEHVRGEQVCQGDWLEYCDDEEDVTSLCLGTGARTGSRKMRFMLKRRMLMILRMADILTEVWLW